MSDLISSVVQHSEIAETSASRVGEFGERAAQVFLKRAGFKIIVANFRTPVGRNRRGTLVTGEIDLIACDDETLCFIEVKTRSKVGFYSPLAAIDLRKQRQIIRTARVYRKLFNLTGQKYRYDAVSVILQKKRAPQISLHKSFWNERKFKKKYWSDDFSNL